MCTVLHQGNLKAIPHSFRKRLLPLGQSLRLYWLLLSTKYYAYGPFDDPEPPKKPEYWLGFHTGPGLPIWLHYIASFLPSMFDSIEPAVCIQIFYFQKKNFR